MKNNNKEQVVLSSVKGNIAVMAENRLIKIAYMLLNARHEKEVFSICEITSLFDLLDVFRGQDNERDSFYLMSDKQIEYNKVYRALHCAEIHFFTDESFKEIVESIIDYFELDGELGSRVFGGRKDEVLDEYMLIAYSNASDTKNIKSSKPELSEEEISELLVGFDDLLEEESKDNQVKEENKKVNLSVRDAIFLTVLSIVAGGLMVKLIDAVNNSSIFDRIFS